MKKKLCLILALTLALFGTSCGGAADSDTNSNVSSNVEVSSDVDVSSETSSETEEETGSESVAESSSEVDLTESSAESFLDESLSENNSPEEPDSDTVTLNLSAFFAGDDIDSFLSLSEENSDVLSSKINEDGSVTIVCTREYYEDAFSKVKTECIRIIEEIVPSGDYPTIAKIEYNDDFTDYYVTVSDVDDYNNSWDSMFMFYLQFASGYYHDFAQTQDVTVNVHMMDPENNEFATENLTDDS